MSFFFFKGWWLLLHKGYTKDGFLYVVINESEYIKNRWTDCVSLLNSTYTEEEIVFLR